MQVLIEEGKTTEKAISKAVERLGVEEDKVEYEVIRKEEKGFLGFIGGSSAIVKVWLKNKENNKNDEVIKKGIYQKSVRKRVKSYDKKKPQGEDIKEIILALNPDTEGETTALYLSKLIKPLKIKVTRIARGLPIGGNLEFADEATIGRAIINRSDF